MAKDYKEIKQRLKSLRQKVSLLESDLDNTLFHDCTEYYDSGYQLARVRTFQPRFFASDDDEKAVMSIVNTRNRIRGEIEKAELEIQQLKEKISDNKIKSFVDSLKNKFKSL